MAWSSGYRKELCFVWWYGFRRGRSLNPRIPSKTGSGLAGAEGLV